MADKLGTLIRDARKATELTQTDVATKLTSYLDAAYTQSMVAKIERGARTLSFEEAAALARILPLDLSELQDAVLPQTAFDKHIELRTTITTAITEHPPTAHKTLEHTTALMADLVRMEEMPSDILDHESLDAVATAINDYQTAYGRLLTTIPTAPNSPF